MDRAVMRRHAPAAKSIGPATLADYRFIITADGYASIEPAHGHKVHGVLWRLTARDRVTLDAWEDVPSGLYRAEMLPVRHAGHSQRALVYIARSSGPGVPKAGYMDLVLAAAGAWDLPRTYIDSLQRWLPARPRDAGRRKLGEFGWT